MRSEIDNSSCLLSFLIIFLSPFSLCVVERVKLKLKIKLKSCINMTEKASVMTFEFEI